MVGSSSASSGCRKQKQDSGLDRDHACAGCQGDAGHPRQLMPARLVPHRHAKPRLFRLISGTSMDKLARADKNAAWHLPELLISNT